MIYCLVKILVDMTAIHFINFIFKNNFHGYITCACVVDTSYDQIISLPSTPHVIYVHVHVLTNEAELYVSLTHTHRLYSLHSQWLPLILMLVLILEYCSNSIISLTIFLSLLTFHLLPSLKLHPLLMDKKEM